MHFRARVIFNNLSVNEGEIEDGLPNGYGVGYFDNGGMEQGYCIEGLREGFC